MGITLKHVAARAGVSRSAVSRTFTPGASVSAATRAKVERAAAELGYAPSALASGLATGRTKLIGLVVSNFRNPIFLEVFDRFTSELQARGLRPLLVNLPDGADPAAAVDMARRYAVDAVIVASSTLVPGVATAFRDAGLPVVHAFGRAVPDPPVPVVGIDNRACGRMAAETLAARGYAKPIFLGGPEQATSTLDRLAGFRAVVPSAPVRFASAYSFAAGHAAMMDLLREGLPADAVSCGDDAVALGALAALRGAGVAVPGTGVLGLNDMEMAGWPGQDLTTIRQPVAEIVDAAIAIALAPPEAPVSRVFPCEIVERATLRPLP